MLQGGASSQRYEFIAALQGQIGQVELRYVELNTIYNHDRSSLPIPIVAGIQP